MLGGYLHQDWPEEHGTAEKAILTFVAENPNEIQKSIVQQLDEIVPIIRKSNEPEKLLVELGCYYLPSADGKSVVEWLQPVRQQLSTN